MRRLLANEDSDGLHPRSIVLRLFKFITTIGNVSLARKRERERRDETSRVWLYCKVGPPTAPLNGQTHVNL